MTKPDWTMLAAAERAIMDAHQEAFDAYDGIGCSPESSVYVAARERYEVFSARAAAIVAAAAKGKVTD